MARSTNLSWLLFIATHVAGSENRKRKTTGRRKGVNHSFRHSLSLV